MAAAKKVKKEVSPNPEKSSETIYLPDTDARIAERAYYKAASRGFAPGHEMDDWLEAEREFNL